MSPAASRACLVLANQNSPILKYADCLSQCVCICAHVHFSQDLQQMKTVVGLAHADEVSIFKSRAQTDAITPDISQEEGFIGGSADVCESYPFPGSSMIQSLSSKISLIEPHKYSGRETYRRGTSQHQCTAGSA
ncbi:uncharacterized [Tachysurus ichikawai]